MLFPSRILMTADAVGGVWTYALELCRALKGFDVQVLLATMGPPLSEGGRQEAAGLENVELVESAFRLEWMDDPWEDVGWAGHWLLELERRFAPNLVHLNGYVHAALPWSAPVLVVAHSCVLSWWRAVKREEAPPPWNRYRAAVEQGLHSAAAVIAPSHAFLDEIEQLYGPLPNAQVIPNGRRAPVQRAIAKKPYVFSGGRLWDEAKNIAAVAGVAPSLQWPVFIAGDHRHPDGRRARLPQVHLLGNLSGSEFAAWLERASLFVLPAKYEPFGLSILEAALAGCALVLGDLATLRETWEDAALFVDPWDVGQLRGAIKTLITHPDRRQQLAQAAQCAAAGLTPSAMTERYLALYASLLAPQNTEAASLCVL